MVKIRYMLSCLAVLVCSLPVFADDEDYLIQDAEDIDILQSDNTINSSDTTRNVQDFDIAGVMLGMSYEDIQSRFLTKHGLYAPKKNKSVVYSLHTDWKYNLDYECRQLGVIIPDKLSKCINGLARDRGLLYVSEIHLVRNLTGETLDIYLTSNATDNVVWRVMYKNDVDVTEGTHEKFQNQREKKILSFWKGVLEKYGSPNSGSDKWVSSENAYSPMMTAYAGGLELIDNGIYANDVAINQNKAKDNFKAKPYAF